MAGNFSLCPSQQSSLHVYRPFVLVVVDVFSDTMMGGQAITGSLSHRLSLLKLTDRRSSSKSIGVDHEKKHGRRTRNVNLVWSLLLAASTRSWHAASVDNKHHEGNQAVRHSGHQRDRFAVKNAQFLALDWNASVQVSDCGVMGDAER